MGQRDVVVIQNSRCETLGSLQKLFDPAYRIHTIFAQTEKIPKDIDYQSLIILGGPMSVYDKLPYLEQEQTLIREALERSIPVLGICLGSQLIAKAIGGEVMKGTKKEIGWMDIDITSEGRREIFRGLGSKLNVFHWHGDTFSLPRGAHILAESKLYPQAFQYRSALGLQFHMEVNNQLIADWITEYRHEVMAENIDPKQLLGSPLQESNLIKQCRTIFSNIQKINQFA